MIYKIKNFTYLAFFIFNVDTINAAELPYSHYESTFSGPTKFRQRLVWYGKELGTYTVDLMPTLKAISEKSISRDDFLESYPHYKRCFIDTRKNFEEVATLLESRDIYEFTIFPTVRNFSPQDIAIKIEKVANGRHFQKASDFYDLRGPIRVLVDSKKKKFIYTYDHYNSFCGPWKLRNYARREDIEKPVIPATTSFWQKFSCFGGS